MGAATTRRSRAARSSRVRARCDGRVTLGAGAQRQAGLSGALDRALWTVPGVPSAELERLTGELQLAPDAGIVGDAWSNGSVRFSERGRELPGSERRQVLEDLGVQAAVAMPIVLQGNVVAVCEYCSCETEPRSDELAESLEAVGAEIGHFLVPRRGELEPARLSPRECEVLQLSAAGQAVAEIAAVLQISPMTVKSHLRHIYEKLEVPGRTAAVAEALRVGLIR